MMMGLTELKLFNLYLYNIFRAFQYRVSHTYNTNTSAFILRSPVDIIGLAALIFVSDRGIKTKSPFL